MKLKVKAPHDPSPFNTAGKRAKFRDGAAWQAFRRFMYAKSGGVCELCEKKYTNISELNIHHKYITQYDNLEPTRFLVVCKTCHEYIHIKYNTPAFKDYQLYGLID